MEVDVLALQDDNERLISIAEKDPLTGIFNKVATEQIINRLVKNYQTGVLLLIDVYQFGEVNYKYGYLAGDEMLCQIIDSLKSMFFKNDIIGRIGRHLFVIFIPICQGEDFIKTRIEQIKEHLSTMEILNGPKKILIHGAGSCHQKGDHYNSLLDRAHKLLEQQKTEPPIKFEQFGRGIKMDTNRIDMELDEKDKAQGAYFLDYETYKCIYRFSMRRFQRIEGNVCVLLLTLTGPDESLISLDENQEWMGLLKNIIRRHLRAGDIFCQYSSSQYMIMLSDVSKEKSDEILQRVTDDFAHLSSACQKDFLLRSCYPTSTDKKKCNV